MQRNCDFCQGLYAAKNRRSRFCSDRCRHRERAGRPRPAPPREGGAAAGPELVDAVRAELVAAGRDGTALGRLALLLAGHAAGPETGAACAAVSRELRATLEAALAGSSAEVDLVRAA